MTTKYGFSNVRNQLVKDLEGAYPTKWEDHQSAKVLGEDFFGSPKPHPNAVLNLFEEQNVKSAIPFAAYRASIGGFEALMSDTPGTVLPRRTLANVVNGMHILQSLAAHAARMVAYRGDLKVCTEETCVLGVDASPIEARMEAVGKLYDEMSKGGVFRAPRLDSILCQTCANGVAATFVGYGSICWERLGLIYGVSDCRDGL